MIKYQMFILLLSCILSACASKQSIPSTQVSLLNSGFEHQWFGVGVTKDNSLQWLMEIDLTAGAKHIRYLDIHCQAQLVLQKIEENTAIFFQAFEVGSQQCKEMVKLRLEMIDDHSIRYRSYDFLGHEMATGILVL